MGKMICMLCGEGITQDHEKSERHQRVLAALGISVVARGFCPFCSPTKSGRLTQLLNCPDPAHFEYLEECRRIVGA